MANYPQPLKQREELNLRLGIKSSLSQLRSVIASLYVIYNANDKQSKVVYSEETNGNGVVSIKLERNLKNKIMSLYGDNIFLQLVEESPLFTSQLEALQVGIELFFHLGKIDFVHSGLSERTGSNRYQKQVAFATNMILIDLLLSSHSADDVKKMLSAWLQEKPFVSELEDRLRVMLNTFTEETQFKIRDSNAKEVIFNQEGVYAEILASNEVSSNDIKEPVGPFRVYKSYLSSGLHPFLVENKQTIKLQENINVDTMRMYSDMVDTSLSLIPKRSFVLQEVSKGNQPFHNEDLSEMKVNTFVDYLPYLTALRTKPFMLLAGISGTGKSRIAREIAKACWETGDSNRTAQVPENFCMIQVKPNWHDSTELLGYVSRISDEPHYVTGDLLPFIAKAWENPNVPYILCLDEMNLAPVEQYFAEYLSVIESRKAHEDGTITTDPLLKPIAEQWYYDLVRQITSDELIAKQFLERGIAIPKNLFVIGTVNMDETTFSFSRKVLDRAMTIEMNEVDLKRGLKETKTNDLGYIGKSIIGNTAEGKDVYTACKVICDEVLEYLEAVNQVLEGTPFKIAYRTRNEFLLYAVNRKQLAPYSEVWQTLDEMTSMKILSRIEGDAERCKKPLEQLQSLLQGQFTEEQQADSISLKKIKEMLGKLNSGYTSYWT